MWDCSGSQDDGSAQHGLLKMVDSFSLSSSDHIFVHFFSLSSSAHILISAFSPVLVYKYVFDKHYKFMRIILTLRSFHL
ncbi:OLC1v1015946C3 [Oldenlandia corymbosa var. corymbosa]|nr:OLC1v1015946C3 [Oldenlandia corymbosa var. corymbosa]